jgi:hypothetical protein
MRWHARRCKTAPTAGSKARPNAAKYYYFYSNKSFKDKDYQPILLEFWLPPPSILHQHRGPQQRRRRLHQGVESLGLALLDGVQHQLVHPAHHSHGQHGR